MDTKADISKSEIKDILPDTESKATTPQTVTVKFNKETKEIPLEDAAAFIQKGMKYDLISKDYEALKKLSAESQKSVGEYLSDIENEKREKRIAELTEKCSGDREFAEKIAELEKQNEGLGLRGFEELKENFPEIKAEEQIPQEVLESAKLSGRLLFDEYLRYLFFKTNAIKQAKNKFDKTEKQSIGSQISRVGKESPEAAEFLKGLWK